MPKRLISESSISMDLVRAYIKPGRSDEGFIMEMLLGEVAQSMTNKLLTKNDPDVINPEIKFNIENRQAQVRLEFAMMSVIELSYMLDLIKDAMSTVRYDSLTHTHLINLLKLLKGESEIPKRYILNWREVNGFELEPEKYLNP